MHLLVTGACGFVGGALIRALLESTENLRVTGIDSLTRAGSETKSRGACVRSG